MFVTAAIFYLTRPSLFLSVIALTQCVLEQIVSEYHQLNDALRAEKRLYQSLSHIHTREDRSVTPRPAPQITPCEVVYVKSGLRFAL